MSSDNLTDYEQGHQAGQASMVTQHDVKCWKCNSEMLLRQDGRWFCTDPACAYTMSHPEFMELASKLADEITTRINAEAPKIKSIMPYKNQYTLELVIEILQDRV